MAAGRIKGITIEIGGDTTKLTSALAKVDNALGKTKTNLRDLDRALKLNPGNTALLKDKQEELAHAISESKSKLETEKEALAQLAQADQTPEVVEQMRQLKIQIDLDTEALGALEDEAKQSSSVLGTQFKEAGEKIKEVGEKIKGVGDSIAGLGKDMTAKVTAPIIGGLGASAKAAIDFEDAMAKVNTIADTSETGVALETLEAQIKELSDSTGVSASEIADNVYNAISAGQKTGDAVNFVGEASKLAVAGFAETGDALDILTTIMNAYGMEAEDVTRVSDVLINTQNLGKTTVAELSAAMGKAIPTAKSNGVEIEDLAGAYAVMTSNGIATAETTTYLNSMMNELGKKGTSAAKAFAAGTEHIKEGGLTMKEAMDSGWELTDVLSILDEQAAESGTTIANLFGSAEAGKAANVLWDNADKLNNAVEAMGESAGATDEAFAKMDTTSRQAQIALNQMKNSAIELGSTVLSMLAPYFGQVVEKIKEVTTWFNSLDESQKQMIVKIAAVIAAIGPALVIVGKVVGTIGSIVSAIGTVTSIIGTLMTSIGGLSGAIALLTSPVTIVIAAIAAVVAAFAYFYNTNEEFRNNVNALVEQVKSIIGGLIEQITAWFKEHETEIKAIIEVVKTIILTGLQNIVTAISTALDVLGSIFKAFEAIMQGDWRTALEYLKSAARSAVNGVTQIFKNLGSMLNSIFKDIISKFKQWGKDMIDNLVNGIKGKIDTVKDAIKNVADVIKSYIHFSVPDVGPLADADTYAPDMMKLFAQGINDNAHLITDAIGTSFDLRPYFTSMNNGLNRLANAATNSANASGQQTPIVVQLSLEADANRLFRVLSEEAHRDWQMTGQSKLMGY